MVSWSKVNLTYINDETKITTFWLTAIKLCINWMNQIANYVIIFTIFCGMVLLLLVFSRV